MSQCRHSPVSFSWTAWDPELCYCSCSSLAQAGRRVDVFSDSKLFFAMTSCVLLEQILDSYSSHSSHSSRTLLFFADGIASRIGWNIILASKDSLSKPASYKQEYITIVLSFRYPLGIHSLFCSVLSYHVTSMRQVWAIHRCGAEAGCPGFRRAASKYWITRIMSIIYIYRYTNIDTW